MENMTTDPGGGVALGRVVHFVVGAGDVDRLRECGEAGINVGDVRAATIVRVWNTDTGSVNLKVHTDAPRDYWATSVTYAENLNATELRAADQPVDYPERTWHWPARV